MRRGKKIMSLKVSQKIIVLKFCKFTFIFIKIRTINALKRTKKISNYKDEVL